LKSQIPNPLPLPDARGAVRGGFRAGGARALRWECAYADWVDAKFVVEGEKPKTIQVPLFAEEAVILTPPAPAASGLADHGWGYVNIDDELYIFHGSVRRFRRSSKRWINSARRIHQPPHPKSNFGNDASRIL
jgi:hypothetical protein